MTATLTPFVYGDQPVRVVSIDGEPWFVLNDLCAVLGLARSASQIKDRLDGGVRQTYPLPTAGGVQQTTVVSEAGMYEVVIRSDKPEAVNFRRWITAEVLPSIRKTGSYGTPQLTGPALMAAALLEADQTMRALTATVDTQRARLRLVEPKAVAFDRWLSTNVDYSVDQIAKALAAAGATHFPSGKKVGRNNLLKDYLGLSKEDGGVEWVYRNARQQWMPYQQHGAVGTKRLSVKLGSYLDSKTGVSHSTATVRITPKGAADLAVLLGAMPETVALHLDGDVDAAA